VRDNAIKNKDVIVENIATAYQKNRVAAVRSSKSGCENNRTFDACVASACNTSMKNKCATSTEKSRAASLCQFHKTRCERLN
jgi:hypothetical protein